MTKKDNLSKSIGYQKGTIVSRTIINKPSGTVTLFAFDQGQGLSEHTAPYDAMVYIVENGADITIAGKVHKLAAGETIIIPAKKPHAVKAGGKFKMLLIMIKS